MKALGLEQVIELIRQRQGKRTQAELAEELGISRTYICDVLNGRRDPGPTVLESLGLKRVYVQAD